MAHKYVTSGSVAAMQREHDVKSRATRAYLASHHRFVAKTAFCQFVITCNSGFSSVAVTLTKKRFPSGYGLKFNTFPCVRNPRVGNSAICAHLWTVRHRAGVCAAGEQSRFLPGAQILQQQTVFRTRVNDPLPVSRPHGRRHCHVFLRNPGFGFRTRSTIARRSTKALCSGQRLAFFHPVRVIPAPTRLAHFAQFIPGPIEPRVLELSRPATPGTPTCRSARQMRPLAAQYSTSRPVRPPQNGSPTTSSLSGAKAVSQLLERRRRSSSLDP